jgi:GLPGLI family protein
MKKLSIITGSILLLIAHASAQDFISKATIEYEVKSNFKKTMGSGTWTDMLKDKVPEIKTSYYHYTFADNKSILKFDHWNAGDNLISFVKGTDEESTWYFDFNTNQFQMQKSIYGSVFTVKDTIPVIKWKLSNESRVIAGFNCRKAVGVIMDSVYVFAFYSTEIMIPGGPAAISGLPGAILGLTIPRLYTSWIATKIMVNDVKLSSIKPLTSKKYYTYNAFSSTLIERSNDWSRGDDPDDKNRVAIFRWNALL